jgi:hypothetical protein
MTIRTRILVSVRFVVYVLVAVPFRFFVDPIVWHENTLRATYADLWADIKAEYRYFLGR